MVARPAHGATAGRIQARPLVPQDAAPLRHDAGLRRPHRQRLSPRRHGPRDSAARRRAGIWIVPEKIAAYCARRREARVQSVETWVDGALAGGLYGACFGRVFFGESMFAMRTRATKIALAELVAFCREHGIETIDGQQRTAIRPRSVAESCRAASPCGASAWRLRRNQSPIGPMICACGGSSASQSKRTRIPIERIQAAEEYVRDGDEWIARCVGRVLQLDPIIKADKARRSVTDLAALERWRLMKPEAAAEQLYTPIKVKPS